jgi:hypothetical protein
VPREMVEESLVMGNVLNGRMLWRWIVVIVLVLEHERFGEVSLPGDDCWGVLQKGRIS